MTTVPALLQTHGPLGYMNGQTVPVLADADGVPEPTLVVSLLPPLLDEQAPRDEVALRREHRDAQEGPEWAYVQPA